MIFQIHLVLCVVSDKDDYLDTILKYLCTTTETSEYIKDNYEYKVLRNGKTIKR
jgi:hypothetical protein